ncbi:MAG: DUF2378 family protein [Myxococcaceae bacterium]|nr:DUF2378 family protein [Myxococcaceae bacterium]
MEEQLVFDTVFKPLLEAHRHLVVGAVVTELQALGLDPTKPLRPAYPVDTFRKVVAVLGRELVPGQPSAVQQREVGRVYAKAFGNSMVGKALNALASAVGRRTTINWVRRAFGATNNFTRAEVVGETDSRTTLVVHHVSQADFLLGVLDVMSGWGRKAPAAARLVSLEAGVATFELTW